MRQPEPADPGRRRYTAAPFPAYRFIPRAAPHPRRDPEGHSWGQPWPRVRAFAPADWQRSEDYLLGIDYFNFAYWWESHEIFEELWHLVGHDTEQGQFLQGVIQVAAAHLHRFSARERVARLQAERGLGRLAGIPDRYMGVDVRRLERDTRAWLEGHRAAAVTIELEGL